MPGKIIDHRMYRLIQERGPDRVMTGENEALHTSMAIDKGAGIDLVLVRVPDHWSLGASLSFALAAFATWPEDWSGFIDVRTNEFIEIERFVDWLKGSLPYDQLPRTLRNGLRIYLEAGIRPGSFLQAVIAGDLVDSSKRADVGNLMVLQEIRAWVEQYLPIEARGSREKLEAWVEKGGLDGV